MKLFFLDYSVSPKREYVTTMANRAYLSLLPASLSFSETYNCQVNNLPSGGCSVSPGEGTLTISFDCNGSSITEEAIETYKAQFSEVQSALDPETEETVTPTLGFIAFVNWVSTTFAEIDEAIAGHGVSALTLTPEQLDFEKLPNFLMGNQSCSLTQAYQVIPESVPCLSMTASIEDETTPKTDATLGFTPCVQSRLQTDFSKNTVFSLTIKLLLPLNLKDELDFYIDTGNPPILNTLTFDWGFPDALEPTQVWLLRNDAPSELPAQQALYHPGQQQLSIGGIPFELDVEQIDNWASQGYVGFVVPTLQIAIDNFQVFFEKTLISGSASISLPCLSSGLKAQFFNVFGKREDSVAINSSAGLNIGFSISPKDCFYHKQFNPRLYCRFEGVIYDRARVNDIIKVLVGLEFGDIVTGHFSHQDPSIKPPEQIDNISLNPVPNKINAHKKVGLREIMIELLIEASQAFTERERHFVEHGTFRKKVATGQFSVWIIGKVSSSATILEDVFYLNRIINTIYEQLKARITPHARMD